MKFITLGENPRLVDTSAWHYNLDECIKSALDLDGPERQQQEQQQEQERARQQYSTVDSQHNSSIIITHGRNGSITVTDPARAPATETKQASHGENIGIITRRPRLVSLSGTHIPMRSPFYPLPPDILQFITCDCFVCCRKHSMDTVS
ncbi:uncharacterized protein LOC26535074 [Drosophila yakuba]|uniref:Uncharacterized protein n=1 Tax=Drosophila yakuba TaxID=7245 RepID=A0A0R1DNF1_DROYA|nr:uncharacterized protein LOC26535074 [Drosophila yakuba]KRJ98780.1 uncharacterized protein Dyak_GE27893 [Drosophila yakuba]